MMGRRVTMRSTRVGLIAWIAAAALASGCGGGAGGGGGGRLPGAEPEGGSTPEDAVTRFLNAAGNALRARRAGQLTLSDQHYRTMAFYFGTEEGSILRYEDAKAAQDRMIVLAGILAPAAFRVRPPAVEPAGTQRTTVTVEITHPDGVKLVPFTVIRGRQGRWYIEQIDLRAITG